MFTAKQILSAPASQRLAMAKTNDAQLEQELSTIQQECNQLMKRVARSGQRAVTNQIKQFVKQFNYTLARERYTDAMLTEKADKILSNMAKLSNLHRERVIHACTKRIFKEILACSRSYENAGVILQIKENHSIPRRW